MVEKSHLRDPGESDELFGEREIRLAGRGIAGKM